MDRYWAEQAGMADVLGESLASARVRDKSLASIFY